MVIHYFFYIKYPKVFLFVCFCGDFFWGGRYTETKTLFCNVLCFIIYFSEFVLKTMMEQNGIKSCITHVTLSETMKQVDCPCRTRQIKG